MSWSLRKRFLLTSLAVSAAVLLVAGAFLYLLFERDFTELYGDWRDWRGMRASNLGFLHELRGHGGCPGYSQPFLPLSDECGTPDF